MHDGAGIALIVAGGAVGFLTAFLLRTRAPAVMVASILTGCGLALGAGALLVQDHVSRTNWVLTLALIAFLVPAHVWIVLGPFGPRPGRG
jgi:hypothetical protein